MAVTKYLSKTMNGNKVWPDTSVSAFSPSWPGGYDEQLLSRSPQQRRILWEETLSYPIRVPSLWMYQVSGGNVFLIVNSLPWTHLEVCFTKLPELLTSVKMNITVDISHRRTELLCSIELHLIM